MLRDLRLAVATLIRRPGYTLAAGGALALGIGASTALFSVINGVLLTPLPFPEPERLVRIFETDPPTGRLDRHLTVATYYDVESGAATLEGMAAYQSGWEYIVDTRDGSGPRLVPGARVFPNTFAVLETPALLGRTFAIGDAPDDEDGVVISHSAWQQLFHGDSAVVGRRFDLEDRPRTVLGVMPPHFAFPDDRVGIWTRYVLSQDARANRRSHVLNVVARVAPTATLRKARTELSGIMDRLRTQLAAEVGEADLRMTPLREAMVGDTRATLLLLFGAVLLLLAIACVNVAGLGIIRGWTRTRELAVRAALGASRHRLAQTILTESAVLAGGAGVVGAVLGWWGTRLLLRLAPVDLPRQGAVVFDLGVLGFVVAAAALVTLVTGCLPVLRAVPTRLLERLKEGTRGSTPGRRSILDVLVTAEVTLSVVLLAGAGLVVRSYGHLRNVDPGVDSQHVLAVAVLPTEARYPDVAAQTALYDRLIEGVAAVPGVRTAGVVTELPFSGAPSTWSLLRPGWDPVDDEIGVHWNPASPGYFETVRLPLLEGRMFDARDRADALPVLVIDRAAARRFFGDESPVGQRVRTSPTSRWYTVIGVVGSVRHESLRDDVQLTMYGPYAQNLEAWRGSRWLVVRTEGAPASVAPAVQEAIRQVDPALAMDRVAPFGDVIGATLAVDRFRLVLLATFAVAALALAVLGLYGTLAYLVTTRTRELALRSALGATAAAIARSVLVRAAWIAGIGVVAGALTASVLGGLLAPALYGVGVFDPLTGIGVGVLVTGVACVAAWWPAARAASLSPATVLRAE